MREVKTIEGHKVQVSRTKYSVTINVGVGSQVYFDGASGHFGTKLGNKGLTEPKVSMLSCGNMDFDYAKKKIKALKLAMKLIKKEHHFFVEGKYG